MRNIVPLNVTVDKFSAIRAKIRRRKAEALVAEITEIDWNNQPRFKSVDDFLNFSDTFVEQSEADPLGLRKRR